MKTNRATIVGIFSFCLLTAIAILIIWKSGITIRATGYPVIGNFSSVSGLLEGAEVRYRGFRVGRVAKIIPSPKKNTVHFWVNNQFKITTGSRLRILFDGLVGEKYLSIVPNEESEEILLPGGTLNGVSTAGLADFVDVGTQSLDQGRQLLDSLRSIFTDKNIIKAIESTIYNLNKITTSMSSILDHNKEFHEMISQMNNTVTALHDLATDDQITSQIRGTVENLESFSERLRQLVEDEAVQGTVQGGKTALLKTNQLLDGLSKISLDTSADIRYAQNSTSVLYDANLRLNLPNSFILLGMGNELGGNKLLTLQPGIKLGDTVNARIGMYKTFPGIGIDYHMTPSIKFKTTLYNFDQLTYDIFTHYQFMSYADLILGVVPNDTELNYTLGISLHSE